MRAWIQHIISPPYNLEQDSLAERMNRTIMDNVQCMLENIGLGKSSWD